MMRSPDAGSVAPVTLSLDPCTDLAARLQRAGAGDMAALGELFLEHGDLVYRTALRLGGSRADAEDATQDVFLRLPAALAGFTGGADAFPAWLRRVSVRQALTQMRGGRRRREVDVEGVAGLLAPSVHQAERLTIDAALARLPDEHRTVFLLKEVEGYSHAEIAELTGISVANSEVRLHRARYALRELLRGSR